MRYRPFLWNLIPSNSAEEINKNLRYSFDSFQQLSNDIDVILKQMYAATQKYLNAYYREYLCIY